MNTRSRNSSQRIDTAASSRSATTLISDEEWPWLVDVLAAGGHVIASKATLIAYVEQVVPYGSQERIKRLVDSLCARFEVRYARDFSRRKGYDTKKLRDMCCNLRVFDTARNLPNPDRRPGSWHWMPSPERIWDPRRLGRMPDQRY